VFFAKHPEYANNDFYITGESYAGHYIPALASRVHQGNKANEGLHINLKVCFLHFSTLLLFLSPKREAFQFFHTKGKRQKKNRFDCHLTSKLCFLLTL
jgi:carboxypeptidase C (cathepsin A)